MENVMNFGPTVVSFKIMAGWKLCFVVKTYVLPNNQPTVHQVEQALSQCLAGTETMIVGDLNARLEQPNN